MAAEPHSRWKHAGALWTHGVWKRVCGGLWTAYGVFCFWRDEGANPSGNWRMLSLVPHIPLVWWLILSLVALLVLGFEASFRAVRATRRRIAQLDKEVALLRESPASDLRLTYTKWTPVSWDSSPQGPGPLMLHLMVKVANGGSAHLEKCQLLSRFLQEPYADEQRVLPYMDASAPFELQPGHDRDLAFISLQFDHRRSQVFQVMWRETGGCWERLKNAPGHSPQRYIIELKAVAAGTAPAQEQFNLAYDDNDGWRLTDTTGRSILYPDDSSPHSR